MISSKCHLLHRSMNPICWKGSMIHYRWVRLISLKVVWRSQRAEYSSLREVWLNLSNLKGQFKINLSRMILGSFKTLDYRILGFRTQGCFKILDFKILKIMDCPKQTIKMIICKKMGYLKLFKMMTQKIHWRQLINSKHRQMINKFGRMILIMKSLKKQKLSKMMIVWVMFQNTNLTYKKNLVTNQSRKEVIIYLMTGINKKHKFVIVIRNSLISRLISLMTHRSMFKEQMMDGTTAINFQLKMTSKVSLSRTKNKMMWLNHQ